MKFTVKFIICSVITLSLCLPIFSSIYFDTKEEIYLDSTWTESQRNQAIRIIKYVKDENKKLKRENSSLKRILRQNDIYEYSDNTDTSQNNSTPSNEVKKNTTTETKILESSQTSNNSTSTPTPIKVKK